LTFMSDSRPLLKNTSHRSGSLHSAGQEPTVLNFDGLQFLNGDGSESSNGEGTVH
jgi:hypothetical protein